MQGDVGEGEVGLVLKEEGRKIVYLHAVLILSQVEASLREGEPLLINLYTDKHLKMFFNNIK